VTHTTLFQKEYHFIPLHVSTQRQTVTRHSYETFKTQHLFALYFSETSLILVSLKIVLQWTEYSVSCRAYNIVRRKQRITMTCIVQHTTAQEQIICTHFSSYRWFSKTFSPTRQNGVSRINICSTFRYTYSRARTELLISIKDLNFNIYIFSSRHKIWKNIKKIEGLGHVSHVLNFNFKVSLVLKRQLVTSDWSIVQRAWRTAVF
jgi:hypothetical protein